MGEDGHMQGVPRLDLNGSTTERVRGKIVSSCEAFLVFRYIEFSILMLFCCLHLAPWVIRTMEETTNLLSRFKLSTSCVVTVLSGFDAASPSSGTIVLSCQTPSWSDGARCMEYMDIPRLHPSV